MEKLACNLSLSTFSFLQLDKTIRETKHANQVFSSKPLQANATRKQFIFFIIRSHGRSLTILQTISKRSFTSKDSRIQNIFSNHCKIFSKNSSKSASSLYNHHYLTGHNLNEGFSYYHNKIYAACTS